MVSEHQHQKPNYNNQQINGVVSSSTTSTTTTTTASSSSATTSPIFANKIDHHHHSNQQQNPSQQSNDFVEYMEVDDNIPSTTATTITSTIIDEQEMSNCDIMPSSSVSSSSSAPKMTLNKSKKQQQQQPKQQEYKLKDVPTLVKRLLKSNEYWYIVSKNWYDQFLAYLNSENNGVYDEKLRPNPIDNKDLLKTAQNVVITQENNKIIKQTQQTYRLKLNLRENEDFIIVPEEVWNLFVKEFGIVDDSMGGFVLRCPIIERTESYLQVELNPLELRLTLYGSKEDYVKQYSRNCKLRDVIDDMRKLFNISETKPIQLWNNATLLLSYTDVESNNAAATSTTPTNSTNVNATSSNNKNSTNTVPSSGSTNAPPPPPPPPPSSSSSSSSNSSKALVSDINQRLLDITELEAPSVVLTIEQENPDHTWPSSKTKLGAVTRSKYASGVPNCIPGVCGLMNLGNTCFMNAAIQCLSNTAPLTEYFLADKHLIDINPDNPLGMRGEIARRYAELIKTMWSGFHSNVAPREFKIAVTQFAPQFSGFAHHDCQELMAFLLDGLHEDLNRVKVKPYIEMKNDIERRPDEIVSKEAWANYKRRNDSIIVDTFHAQLKSTLVCPECELVSVTFDPFCYLTLPLPYRIEKSVDILFIPAISKRPVYRKNSTISASATSTSSSTTMNRFQGINMATQVRSILLENVMIPKTGCANDIRVAVAKYLNDLNIKYDNANSAQQSPQPQQQRLTYFNRKFDPKKMVVTNIMECRLNKIYQPTDYYNPHLDDIVVYELDDPTSGAQQNPDQQQKQPGSTIQTRSSTKSAITSTGQQHFPIPVFIRQINADHSESIISRPFFINLKSLTYESIRDAIFKELSSLVSQDKLNNFLQAMEETYTVVVDNQSKDNSNSFTKLKKRSGSVNSDDNDDDEDEDDDDGADGDNESSDYDDDMNNSNNKTNNNNSNDEGVDEIYGSTKTSTNKNKNRTKTYPSYTIVTVNNNAQCVLSTLQPGNRLDASFDDSLAINIHYRIVTKFFPTNLNRAGFLRLSELLSSINGEQYQQQLSNSSLLTLKECINQFTLVEKLGENDPWYCPRCKKHQMASKKFDIWSLPNNLIIHLKRFSYSRLHRDKLNVLVEFPIENLDMSPYVLHNPNNESFVYDLIAVSNHYGELGGGHYTAYAKNFQTNNWFLFDDYSVTPISDKNKVMTKAAYVLFYQRKQPQQQQQQ